MEEERTRENLKLNQGQIVLLFLLCVALFSVYKLIRSFINPIILAVLLASLLSPINNMILKIVKNRKNLAALLSCVFLFFIIVLPFIFVTISLFNQGLTTFSSIQEWFKSDNPSKLIQSERIQKILQWIEPYLPDDVSSRITQTAVSVSSGVGKFLLDQGGFLLGNISAFVMKFFLMLFVFFFMVRDGREILKKLLYLLPLSSTHERHIIEKIKGVSRSVFMGFFLTSLCQGTAGGLALGFAGLPGLFLGTMMVFTSLIPFIGTALIWVPSAIFLLIKGLWLKALLISIWHIAVIGMMDNILRPLFMTSGSGMNPLMILFAILGGIQLFGILGILYGPMIFGLTMVLLYIYELEFGVFLKHQENS